MLPNCQLSCHSCKTDSEEQPKQKSQCGTGKESKCCNKEDSESCEYWASIGECEKNPNFMLKECKLSCHACRRSFPKLRAQKCRDNGMTKEVRQKFLNMHNKYRSLVAKGKAKEKKGGNAPKAARMMKMVYDCDIEESAMRHAVGC
ncbi:shTK domain protein, partial [Ancylostoma caninum]